MYLLAQTILFFLLFIAFSLLVLYVPGFWMIASKRRQLENQEILTLSLSLGIVAFILIAIVLALLNLRYFVLPLIITMDLFVLYKYRLAVFGPWKIFIKDKILLALILAGILTQGLINFPSGYLYKDGINFWSSQGHDGIWHVSLMEEVKRGIPIKSPVFAGENLYNYHYLVDILMGEFSRIFSFFSPLDIYFRFFPVVFSLLLGISVFALVSRWQQNKAIGYLAIFFTYFVGSFGYVVTFMKEGSLFAGETVFWAAQQNSLLGNPPHAVSHGIMAAFFLSFLIYLKERKPAWLLISFFIASMLAGFKVSGGLVLLVGVGAAAVVDFISKRKFSVLILAFGLGLSNLITFKAMTSSEASSFLMFLPWWFVRTMVVDKLGWMDMELRRQHYISKGTWHAWLRVLQLETTAFMIFLVGNLGMRVVGSYSIVKGLFVRKSYQKPFEVMLLVTMITGFLVPIFFVQKGIIYNNIQFMQYFLFIFGFFGAIATYNFINLFKNKKVKVGVLILIAMLSLPTVIGNLNELYGPGRTSLSKISNQDLEALQYLKEHSDPETVVLTVPFNQYLKDKFPDQPRPIYSWYSTAYIPALTGRRTYLTSEEQVLITGYPVEERLVKVKTFFEQKDISAVKNFLKEASISYIYVVKSELKEALDTQRNGLDIFFENNEVIIYKVRNSS